MLGSLYSKFVGKAEARVLFVGLDGSGKTTITYRLKHGKVDETEIIPTIGFNCECVEYRKMILSIWDLGGPADTRSFWRLYYPESQAVVFVVDSSDVDRMDEAREELHRMLTEHDLWDAPLLVLANKQDLPTALTMREITEALQLFQLSGRNWYIIDTRALHEDFAESNLHAGLDWLVETLNIPSAMRQEKAKLEHNERVKQANEAGAGPSNKAK